METNSPTLLFRSDINGLRALAVFSVVAFHIDRHLLAGGFVGVDIFFVISGYLISRIILTEMRADAFSIAGFYAKRVKRIFPALAIVLICVWAVGLWRLDPSALSALAAQQLDGALFTLNFRLASENDYFDAVSEAKPLLHLWSLCIEEQFYLVAPVLLMLMFRTERFVAPALLLIFLSSLTIDLLTTPLDPTGAFFLPWSRAWELALGACVAYRELHRRGPASSANVGVASLAGLAIMMGSILLLNESQPFPGWRAMLPTGGCALVLANVGGAWSDRILCCRPAQSLGAISYPLYLWHWPLLSIAFISFGEPAPLWLRIVLAGAAVGLAAATYRLVEKPIAVRFTQNSWGMTAALVLALAGCAIVGKITRVRHGFPGRYPAEVAAIFEFPPHHFAKELYRAGTCFEDRGIEAQVLTPELVASHFAAASCDAPANPKLPTILILGDSHGAHLYPGVKAVFGGRANILQLDANFCAPLVEHVDRNAGVAGTERCQIINDYVFARVRALRPQIVLVGAYFESFLDSPAWLYPGFIEAFARGAARLHETGGSAVIIAGQVPIWTSSLPSLVAHEWQLDGKTAMYSKIGLDQRSLAVDSILRSQPWPAGVSYVSLVRALCNDDGCLRRVGDDLPEDLMAVDYGHFSKRGSLKVVREILAPEIDRALRPATK
jgi:peptidoglycan/LPS O-acetylase OafA/YrhL